MEQLEKLASLDPLSSIGAKAKPPPKAGASAAQLAGAIDERKMQSQQLQQQAAPSSPVIKLVRQLQQTAAGQQAQAQASKQRDGGVSSATAGPQLLRKDQFVDALSEVIESLRLSTIAKSQSPGRHAADTEKIRAVCEKLPTSSFSLLRSPPLCAWQSRRI
jgi:hypothetical protein